MVKKGLLTVRQMSERKQLCLFHYHLVLSISAEFPKQYICHSYLNVSNHMRFPTYITCITATSYVAPHLTKIIWESGVGW